MSREFQFEPEILELRSMVREFCAEFSPESVVRKNMESELGYDPALWRRLGSEIGVLGLAVPEEFGGADAGLVALAVAVDELGAALVCGPVLGTLALAIPALCALSNDQAKRELPALCSGDRTATLVAPLWGGAFDAAGVTVSAERDGARWSLTGDVAQAPDAAAADTLLVAASTADGVGLFAVDAEASGLSRTSLTTLDLTRRQAAVSFASAPATLLAGGAEASAAIERVALVAATLLAVEQVGGSQRMLDATLAHVSTRIQFGQAVGSYQAVKHRCANMFIQLELARSAAYHAVWALEDDAVDDARLATSLAKATASEAFAWISGSAIQMHGGLGFAWEGTPHLYFKRATTDALVLGDASSHVDRVAQLAIDTWHPAPPVSAHP